MAAWLPICGSEAGLLFCTIDKGGTLKPGRASAQLAWVVLRRRARQAGIAVSCSPHDLRRTFVGDLLEAGADVGKVQRLAGHQNVQTTLRYDRRPAAALREATGLLHTPYLAPERVA